MDCACDFALPVPVYSSKKCSESDSHGLVHGSLFSEVGMSKTYLIMIIILVLISIFVDRSIIYPLRMTKRARPVPSLVCLSAFIFCCYNGLLQGHFLINVHMINGSSPFFFAGKYTCLVSL